MDHGVFRKFAALGVSALVTVFLVSPATISPVFSSAAILAAPAGTARGSVTTAPLKVSDNPATGSNLVRDGSFESPIVPSGGYSVFSTGQTSTAWSVVGAPGNVAVISGKFTQNGFSFPAAVGAQWLDLTGTSNTPTGVAETVTTTPGQAYTLSFSVGNVYDPGGIFGTTSTVTVLVNGTQVFSATNSGGSGTQTQVWQQFVVKATASSTQTTISFINGDPTSDTCNGLDGISLVAR